MKESLVELSASVFTPTIIMKNKILLQWQLTFFTAILVTVACIILQIILSSSAMFYMDSIGNSVITVFPEINITEEMHGTEEYIVDVPKSLVQGIEK